MVLSLSGSGSPASLITGLTATKKARTVPASSTGLTGTISTALTASASSVNRPLNVSFCLLLHIFHFFSLCACLFSYLFKEYRDKCVSVSIKVNYANCYAIWFVNRIYAQMNNIIINRYFKVCLFITPSIISSCFNNVL